MDNIIGLKLIWIVVLGIFAGSLSGMLGVGSGIVIIPALVILFSFPQKMAQGISLMVMVPMALVSAIRYYTNPSMSIDLKIVALLAVTAMIGAIIGSTVAFNVPVNVLRKIFGVFIIISGIFMLTKK